MSNLLLVEDDKDLAMVIKEWLGGQNIDLEVCHDGRDGYERLMQGDYEMAILDLNLPSLSGLDICRQYRSAQGKIPVLMLTGRGQVLEKAEGFEAGADDYLTKPFSLRELSARLRALQRRSKRDYVDVLKVGALEMDPAQHRVWLSAKPIHLLPKDFAVLEFFMRHPNEVFSALQILRCVWNSDADVTIEAVKTCIKRLRKKLDGTSGEDQSVIETVARVGYRLGSCA